MKFDPSISLGNIIQVGLLILACIGALVKLGRLDQKVDIMFTWFERKVIDIDPPKKVGKPNGHYMGLE